MEEWKPILSTKIENLENGTKTITFSINKDLNCQERCVLLCNTSNTVCRDPDQNIFQKCGCLIWCCLCLFCTIVFPLFFALTDTNLKA